MQKARTPREIQLTRTKHFYSFIENSFYSRCSPKLNGESDRYLFSTSGERLKYFVAVFGYFCDIFVMLSRHSSCQGQWCTMVLVSSMNSLY